MADQKITALTALAEADVQATVDQLPIADVSTSETKKVSPAAVVGAALKGLAPGSVNGALIAAGSVGTAQLADGAVTNIKVAAGLDGGKLVADSVTAREIAANAVTASELADGAVDTAAIVDGAVTDAKLAAGISGAKLTAGSVTATQLGADSVGATQLADGAVDTAAIQDSAIATVKIANLAVTTDKLAADAVTTVKVVDGAITTGKLAAGAVDDSKISGPIALGKLGTAAANTMLAGPTTGAAATPVFRALVGADLPPANASVLGGVKVNTTSGLTIGADGTLGLTLSAPNLPLATAGSVGAVMPGTGLSVDPTGSLSLTNSIGAGTATKVTFNAQGMITSTSALVAADIPDLDASKITTGTLPGSHIADRSINQQKLADYATAYIQEASPGTVTGTHPIGELWFQESTAKLAMWNGNSWMPVGQGALSDENMRFCGLFNATTGLVTALTPYGTVAGLTNGGAIPSATNQLTGVYLACDTAGTHDGKTYDVGDWIMCLGQARGWERLDLASGGGGGGGGKLGDLVDVTLTTPADGDVLKFNGTTWVNGGTPDPGSY